MPANDKNLPYFQTLHSFAFNLFKLNEEDIMQPIIMKSLVRNKCKSKILDKYNKEEIIYLTCDNPYFQLIHRAVNKM